MTLDGYLRRFYRPGEARSVVHAMQGAGYDLRRPPHELLEAFIEDAALGLTRLREAAGMNLRERIDLVLVPARSEAPDARTRREAQLRELGGLRIREFVPLREAAPVAGETSVREVVLISAGKGNRRDRNFYGPDMLRESTAVFEGVTSFLNHPTKTEEHERPERDVRDKCGWFSNVRVGRFDGREALIARFTTSTNSSGGEAKALVESDLEYQRQRVDPDKVFVGFSINAEGPSHEEVMDGETWNVVDKIEYCMSVDLVTFPARGGKVINQVAA